MSTQKIPHVRRRLAILLIALTLAMVITPAAFADVADTDENTPRLTQQPDQLVLQLGVRWAGVEFELRTDAGLFPVPVVVDSSGVLTMDLGGSTTYTLSCINSETPIPAPGPEPEPDTTAPPSEQPSQPVQPTPAPAQGQAASVVPVILFLAGLALAAGGGAALFFSKRGRQPGYDDWGYDEDEL